MFKYFKIGVAIFFGGYCVGFHVLLLKKKAVGHYLERVRVECGLGNHRCLCQKKDAKKISLNIGIINCKKG